MLKLKLRMILLVYSCHRALPEHAILPSLIHTIVTFRLTTGHMLKSKLRLLHFNGLISVWQRRQRHRELRLTPTITQRKRLGK